MLTTTPSNAFSRKEGLSEQNLPKYIYQENWKNERKKQEVVDLNYDVFHDKNRTIPFGYIEIKYLKNYNSQGSGFFEFKTTNSIKNLELFLYTHNEKRIFIQKDSIYTLQENRPDFLHIIFERITNKNPEEKNDEVEAFINGEYKMMKIIEKLGNQGRYITFGCESGFGSKIDSLTIYQEKKDVERGIISKIILYTLLGSFHAQKKL